jgi:hypothetical protein
MSTELIGFLEGMDSAFTSGVAATLTGMTLTAASLLANLVKSQSDRLNDLYEKKTEREREAAKEEDPSDKIIMQRAAKVTSDKYDEAAAAASGVTGAFRALLIGFVAFVINLIESLTLDPNVEKSLLDAAGLSKTDTFLTLTNYTPWLYTDVGISLGSLGIGLGALCYAAAKMTKVIPKL